MGAMRNNVWDPPGGIFIAEYQSFQNFATFVFCILFLKKVQYLEEW